MTFEQRDSIPITKVAMVSPLTGLIFAGIKPTQAELNGADFDPTVAKREILFVDSPYADSILTFDADDLATQIGFCHWILVMYGCPLMIVPLEALPECIDAIERKTNPVIKSVKNYDEPIRFN